jgi:hypothetical protein
VVGGLLGESLQAAFEEVAPVPGRNDDVDRRLPGDVVQIVAAAHPRDCSRRHDLEAFGLAREEVHQVEPVS